MARKDWTYEGLDAYLKELEKISADTEDICKKALYQGAAVMASFVKAEIPKIPDRKWHGKRASGLTPEDKADLERGFGIAKMRNADGVIDVKLGFDGYGSDPTKKYPKGFPIPFTARAICKGTSWLQKYDFIGKAERAAKSAVEGKIKETFDTLLKDILK